MKITEASVKHPITTTMAFIGLAILGLVSLSRLGQELFPDVNMPSVAIYTGYPGVGPYEVEAEVTRPIEEALVTMNGVETITSTSSESVSMVMLGFSWSTDLDGIVPEVREYIDSIESELPEAAHRPGIFKLNPQHLPCIQFNVSTQTEGIETRQLVEELIVPEIEKIEGVARVTVYGGREQAVLCKLDLTNLANWGIPITQILQIFQGENVSLPAGSMNMDGKHLILRTVGDFETLEDIGDILVTYVGHVPVLLRDVADIRVDYLPQEQFLRAGGSSGVMVSVNRQPGHNTIQVVDEIKELIEGLQTMLPPSVQIQIQSDQSISIERSIGSVATAAWQGGLLAILVLLFFLRNIRSTLIISIVIPLSVVATFSLMDFGGLSINMISLMGITLGVGMFVDNSIVVLESIFRKQLAGFTPRQAAIDGAQEVSRPIIASTLTTVSVFVPMIFVEGMAGLIFDDLSSTISFALFISLAVALTFIPVLCARYMRVGGVHNGYTSRTGDSHAEHEISLADVQVNTGNNFIDDLGSRIQNVLLRLDDGYEQLLTLALRHRLMVIVTAVSLLAASLGSVMLVGMEFLPEADEGTFSIFVETRMGSSYEATTEKIMQMERIITEVTENSLVAMSSQIGEGGDMLDAGSIGSHLATIYVRLNEKNKRDVSVWEMMNILDERISSEVSDIKYRLQVEGISSMAAAASGDSSPIVVEFSGDNLDEVNRYALKAKTILERVDGVRNVKTSLRTGKPEIQFRIKRREALSLGLSPLEIAASVRTAYKGTKVSRFRNDEYDLDVYLMFGDEDRVFEQLPKMFFVNRAGTRIPLENVVEIVVDEGPVSIRRIQRTRVVKVTGSLTGERALSRVLEDFEKALATDLELPMTIDMKRAGTGEEMGKSFRSLFYALILAVVLVYMVMASQFESLLHPFIVMFSVPFAAIGLVLALLVTGTTFSLLAFVGAIMLVGIVVNNAIVLIDYINLLRDRGVPLWEAVVKGGKTRLKPILMTTMTTVLGLMPMSLGLGTGSEISAPMGRAVVGGLTTSTLITLVLIPVLYHLVETLKERRSGDTRQYQHPNTAAGTRVPSV